MKKILFTILTILVLACSSKKEQPSMTATYYRLIIDKDNTCAIDTNYYFSIKDNVLYDYMSMDSYEFLINDIKKSADSIVIFISKVRASNDEVWGDIRGNLSYYVIKKASKNFIIYDNLSEGCDLKNRTFIDSTNVEQSGYLYYVDDDYVEYDINKKWNGDYSVEFYIPEENKEIEKCNHKFEIYFADYKSTYYHWGGVAPEMIDCEITEINDSIVSFSPIDKDELPHEGGPLAQLFRKNGKYFIKGPFIYDKDFNVMLEVTKTEIKLED